MIELMDGFFIAPNMGLPLSQLRHRCGSGIYDQKICRCGTPVSKKVVVMYKLWEFNQ